MIIITTYDIENPNKVLDTIKFHPVCDKHTDLPDKKTQQILQDMLDNLKWGHKVTITTEKEGN